MKKCVHTFSLLIICVLTTGKCVKGQEQRTLHISGRFVDSVGKPIEGVSILVASTRDSSTTFSSNDGRFALRIQHAAQLVVTTRHLGYMPTRFEVKVRNDRTSLELGSLTLKQRTIRLETAEVGSIPRIYAKGDTVFFETNHIHLDEGSLLWELIDQIPGMRVNAGGSLSYMGQPVEKARINGIDFFGGDIGLALRNLPADMIQRLQLIDEYGPHAAETGFRSGEAQKVLNLSIDDEQNQGVFTEGQASYGLKSRYLADLGGFHFKRNQQIAVSTALNNRNVVPMWTEEARLGTLNNPDAHQDGIQAYGGGRLIYTDQWKEGTVTHLGILGQRQRQETFSRVEEYRDFGSVGQLYRYSTSAQQSNHRGYRLGSRQQQTPLLRYVSDNQQTNVRLQGYYSHGQHLQSRTDHIQQQFLGEEVFAGGEQNFFDQTRLSEQSDDGEVALHITQKMAPLGSSLSFSGRLLATSARSDKDQVFTTREQRESKDEDVTLLRFTGQRNRSQLFSTNLNYTIPFGRQHVIQSSLLYSKWDSRNRREVFDRPSANILGYGETLIDSLSTLTDLSNQHFGARIGIQNRVNRGWQYDIRLEGNIHLQSGMFKESGNFQHQNMYLAPAVRVAKRSQRSVLEMSTGWQIGVPTLQQLDPIGDMSDPLFIRRGNPDLIPEQRYQLSLGWNSFGGLRGATSRISLKSVYVKDKIVPRAILHHGPGQWFQEYNFANLDGNYQLDLSYDYNEIHAWPAEFRGRTAFQGAAQLLQDMFYEGATVSRSVRSYYSARLTESLERSSTKLRAAVSYRLGLVHRGPMYGKKAQHDIQCALRGEAVLLKNYSLSAAVGQSFRFGYPKLLADHPTIVDVEVRRYIVRRRLSAGLVVNDLLSQRSPINRILQFNQVSNTHTNSLGREVYLSVRWNFGKFGAEAPMFLF